GRLGFSVGEDGLAPVPVQLDDGLGREINVLELNEIVLALGLDPLFRHSVARLDPVVVLALFEVAILAAAVFVSPVIAILGLAHGFTSPLAFVELLPLALTAGRHGLRPVGVQAA